MDESCFASRLQRGHLTCNSSGSAAWVETELFWKGAEEPNEGVPAEELLTANGLWERESSGVGSGLGSELAAELDDEDDQEEELELADVEAMC